ncbi:hypothetical protein FRB90_008643 [Tulasnella sp. 427]|nr:hypothetical protein FRB90_008643 [Tulasnella sp. 427]
MHADRTPEPTQHPAKAPELLNSIPKDAATATPAPESPSRKVVTSLLITMPIPHHAHSHSEGAQALFEAELPEVVFGVCKGR